MARQIEAQRQAEIRAAEEKRARNLKLIAEVEAANGIALAKKSELRAQELEEEQKIVRYNQEKVAREVAHALEERRLKEEKEKEVARLREMQEKAADRQSEIDALRAKREFLDRESTMANQAKAERDDFLRIIDRQKEEEAKERELDDEKRYALRNHANVIR